MLCPSDNEGKESTGHGGKKKRIYPYSCSRRQHDRSGAWKAYYGPLPGAEPASGTEDAGDDTGTGAGGGIPVLAHPGQQQNFSVIPDLVCEGLWGIEKNHPSNSREDRKNIQELAQRYGLFCTGGSDYHGLYEAKGADLGDFLSENHIEKTGRRL